MKYVTFSVPINKGLDNGKTFTYKLLLALDLCRPHYQVLLITYLKFIKRNAKDAWKEKKSNQYAILLGLKIMNYITNAKNVKKIVKNNKWVK